MITRAVCGEPAAGADLRLFGERARLTGG